MVGYPWRDFMIRYFKDEKFDRLKEEFRIEV